MNINIQCSKPNFDYQFQCKDHGIIGVYGISGSGKSSLLDAIAGYNHNLNGQIIFRDKTLFDSQRKRSITRCNYMCQNPLLFPHWDIQSNLEFVQQYCQKTIDLQALLRTLNCQHLINKYPHQLSGGEKQRIALIRTIMQIEEHGLVLLDEPFNAMDTNTRHRALQLLNQHKKNALLFLVTHDVHEIYQYADQFMYIDQGRICFQNSITNAMASNHQNLPLASRIDIKQQNTVIYADDISISLQKNDHSSIMHQWSVTINDIAYHKLYVIIRMNVMEKNQSNNNLIAKITHHSLNKLQLKNGMKVFACFKASSYQTQS